MFITSLCETEGSYQGVKEGSPRALGRARWALFCVVNRALGWRAYLGALAWRQVNLAEWPALLLICTLNDCSCLVILQSFHRLIGNLLNSFCARPSS